MSEPTADDLEALRKLRRNLAEFGRQCLKIRTKEGKLVNFELNAVQRVVHAQLQAQLKDKGWVRALVLKGRRPGVSTYVAARFYHKTSTRAGVNTYILAHEQAATDTLFGIVDRYQSHNPLAPHVGASNAKELIFDKFDSSYSVATAGQKAGGRSKTTQLFHGSECAFWANAADHFASSVQTVSLMPGTEVILESTANGPGGEFYERWQMAEAGIGDYIGIFIPWFMDPDNSRPVEDGFSLAIEADEGQMSEAEYCDVYGLTLEQMAWRRGKIAELRSEEMFRQEYPACASEAWVTPGHDPFISPILVLRARKRKIEGAGPLILGVDPASMGGDRFSVAARRGPAVLWVKSRTHIDAEEGKAWIRDLIEEHDPARVNIDAGNIGHAIISGLKANNPKLAKIIRGINFGGVSEHRLAKPKVPGPYNRRAEMWARSKEWLEWEEGVSLPDMDTLQSDASAPRLKPRLDHNFLLESKQEMKARGVRSPDEWDAIVLTFATKEYFASYTDEPVKTPGAVPFGTKRGGQATTPVLQGYRGPQGWLGS